MKSGTSLIPASYQAVLENLKFLLIHEEKPLSDYEDGSSVKSTSALAEDLDSVTSTHMVVHKHL